MTVFPLFPCLVVSLGEIGQVDLLGQKFSLFRALTHFPKRSPKIHPCTSTRRGPSCCFAWVSLPVRFQKGEEASGTLTGTRQTRHCASLATLCQLTFYQKQGASFSLSDNHRNSHLEVNSKSPPALRKLSSPCELPQLSTGRPLSPSDSGC